MLSLNVHVVRGSARKGRSVLVLPACAVGRLLLRAVLVAVLPNFLDLLASDYKRWAAAGGTTGAPPRDIEGAVGQLFADVQQDAAA